MVVGGGVYVVQQQTNVIIERLGKFNRIAGPGIHLKIPFLETIAKRVNLRTDQVSFRIDAKTKDNVTVTMDIAAQYHVNMLRGNSPEDSGIYRSYYMLSEPINQISD